MKKSEVKVGGLYIAKVSDRLVTVRIDSTHSKGGWNATNTTTGKRIRIKSAQRLRGMAGKTTKAKAPKAAGAVETPVRPDLAARDDEKAGAREETEAVVANDEKPEAPVGAANKEGRAEKAATEKAKSKKAGDKQKPKHVGALDAAAQVLAKADNPMRARELIAAMAEQGLWTSPAGKTPHGTLHAAIIREIAVKGDAARFKKVDRGLFAFNKAGA